MLTLRNALAGLLSALLLTLGTAAALADAPFEAADRVDLVHVDQRLLAVRSGTSAVLEVALEVGERVFDLQNRGAIGVASTSTRLLGITSASPDWTELRYRLSERVDGAARLYVQDRVALVALPQRLVALSARQKAWLERPLAPSESGPEVLADDDVAVAITPRRAVGFSATSGDFAEVHLSPREKVERRSVEDGSITLITDRRVLVFRAGGSGWAVVDRRK